MKKYFLLSLSLILVLSSYLFAQDVSGGISTEYWTVIYKLQYGGSVHTHEGVGRIHTQRLGNYDAQWNLTYLGIPGTPVKFAIAIKDTFYNQNQTWNITLGPSSPY